MSIDEEHIEYTIPSASGIAISNDSAYIIGDDASYIYKLSITDWKFRRISFPGVPPEYRISKAIKHDYESAVIGSLDNNSYLLAFGSGTLSPFRDSLLIMNIKDEKIKKYSLASFYEQLVTQYNLDKKNFNIEGCTIAGNDLYIFNRGNNMVFQTSWPEFFEYITMPGTKKVPASRSHTIRLPVLAGVQAGISGATTLDDKTILITASLENTKDWTMDGEISGSYIGVLKMMDQQLKLDTAIFLQQNNYALKAKLESIDIISSSKKSVVMECVADNDDGSSSFYKISLAHIP